MATTYPLEVNNGITTTWLPVIPSITPTGCGSTLYAPTGIVGPIFAYDPNQFATEFATPCLPGPVTSWWNQNGAVTKTSLGPFNCPSGYYNAVTSAAESSTITACCPSNYVFKGWRADGFAQECYSTISLSQTITYVSSNTANNMYITTTAVMPTSTVVGAVHANGWNRDAVASTSTSGSAMSVSSTSSTIPTSIISSTTTPPFDYTSSLPTSSSTPRGISTVTLVCIIASTGTCAILLIALWVWMRRRKRKEREQRDNAEPKNVESPVGNGKWASSEVHEVNGDWMPHELGGGMWRKPVELQAGGCEESPSSRFYFTIPLPHRYRNSS